MWETRKASPVLALAFLSVLPVREYGSPRCASQNSTHSGDNQEDFDPTDTELIIRPPSNAHPPRSAQNNPIPSA
jgi:hypothetical protein